MAGISDAAVLRIPPVALPECFPPLGAQPLGLQQNFDSLRCTGEGFQNDGCFDWNVVKSRDQSELRQAGKTQPPVVDVFCTNLLRPGIEHPEQVASIQIVTWLILDKAFSCCCVVIFGVSTKECRLMWSSLFGLVDAEGKERVTDACRFRGCTGMS